MIKKILLDNCEVQKYLKSLANCLHYVFSCYKMYFNNVSELNSLKLCERILMFLLAVSLL